MKHHFGDLLDRVGDYWTIVPNKERYAHSADDEIENKDIVKILTITKYDKNWEQVFDCPNIEELTLHEPSKKQIQEIGKVTQTTRLRITHLRTNDIEFIGRLYNVEELILEYVSGFCDLSPLQKLPNIKSVHFENLRRVSNFDGLKGLDRLRYLHIDGTLDWHQPIENFTFLCGLPNLEVFSLGSIVNKTEFPALSPIVKLEKLRKIKIGRSTFQTKEYAFLQAALPGVEGCSWDLCWNYRGSYEFLGKRAGWVNKNSPNARSRCEEFTKQFEEMKKESEKIIKSYHL
jgi:hypothetical protein